MAQTNGLQGLLGDWTRADVPLYEALADRLEGLIAGGRLPAGARLPAQRQLADTLAVSRGTVMAAYDRLLARGLVEAKQGSGTRVRPGASPATGPREAHLATDLRDEHIYGGLLHPQEGVIDLRASCWIGAEDLPAHAFDLSGDAVLAALRRTHGYFPVGIPALRRALAQELTAEGLPTAPEEVLVTTGAQQAIDLVANLVIAPGDDVVVEELSYPGALDALRARQARLHPAPLTAHGVDVDRLHRTVTEVAPRLVYLIPTCHNPTGSVLPASHARRLAELAADWEAVVIDDRSLARFPLDREREVPPPLAAHAGPTAAQRILTVGSLSKSFWGGLRIGFVRAQGRLLDRLARLKTVADIGTPVTSQVTATRLLAGAPGIVAARRRVLVERYEALTTALAQVLPDWRWQPPAGGMCLWVRLPPGTDSTDLTLTAARHGVGLAPGTASSAQRRHADHMRLPYTQPPEVLEEAVQRLARAWSDYRGRASALDNPGLVV